MTMLARLIKVERAKQDLSQKELADLAGTTQRYISAIECGIKFPRKDKFEAIINALGVELEFIQNI